MILRWLYDKYHRMQDRNDGKASSLTVNSGTNEVWFPMEFCLLVDSAACNKVKLRSDAFTAAEASAIAHSS